MLFTQCLWVVNLEVLDLLLLSDNGVNIKNYTNLKSIYIAIATIPSMCRPAVAIY